MLMLTICTGIRLVLRFVPSHWNFADGPSRGGAVGVDPETAAKAILRNSDTEEQMEAEV